MWDCEKCDNSMIGEVYAECFKCGTPRPGHETKDVYFKKSSFERTDNLSVNSPSTPAPQNASKSQSSQALPGEDLTIECKQCGLQGKVPSHLKGKNLKCPQCSAVFTV